ncbi:transcriptional regulator, MarR family with acetyltransferase activity [Chitinophaga terrae (ex Kim and Jung 2007)]|uniref:Transcriptional regulator, MarR family with acetyltransferase activity n=1 Tax=Chitinophaga terrae (ex Kim and Jung 2007) TaxID=408074 RepID=A0A1H3ZEY6_9BACT|nr:bifunctional helix-turn-helix transcriptional regulator/GNAT family N-acetyltransferase [Chitinophaga terrae (ex Kim and Jung 2007)]GEP88722.1 MarR family transcriptional regulator [Chitinophaga terrae (ex Kim and Jung 2007)]SEA22353.1 transcriptional regulator, MarR family with acetyltransferase activity [Chitinophaga terrae (ex Kim and Jung 2007)]
MEFFNKTGKMAIGSRLRLLTEKLTEDAASVYQAYGHNFQPKWFPVYFALLEGGASTITQLAKEIGHSHPSVSKIIAEMVKAGLVKESKDPTDKRRTTVELSAKGWELEGVMREQFEDVSNAIKELTAQANNDLWQAISEWEYLLEQQPLSERVKVQRKKRESGYVRIVPFTPAYRKAFRDLNEAWITRYFKMEESDYKSLDHPDTYILDKGGYIAVALYKEEVVGVCALIKMQDPDYDYELAKLAVSPAAQGKNIGFLLCEAIIEKAKELGAKKIYLESNTILKPAIQLYHKLGFKKVTGRPTPYERADIQMELVISA